MTAPTEKLPESVENAIANLRVQAVRSTYPYGAGGHDEQGATDSLRAAIVQAIADEREACAKVCDEFAASNKALRISGASASLLEAQEHATVAAEVLAEEIRARARSEIHR